MWTLSAPRLGGFDRGKPAFALVLVALILPMLLSIVFAAPMGGIHLRDDERVPDDATKWRKVYDWMKEKSVVDKDKAVFYSDSNVGQPMAAAFCKENTGYQYFWSIFDPSFQKDFGDLKEMETDVIKACSKAMAAFVKGEVRVFNDAMADDSSYWLTIEEPILQKSPAVTKIWAMDDNTLDPSQHEDGDIKEKNIDKYTTLSDSDLADITNYLGSDWGADAADSCDVSYQFVDDFFEIRGKFWPTDPIGSDGAGLLQQLQGCAGSDAISNWSFTPTPDDTTYDWYAHGDIVIGQKSCVGNAVVSAGGPSKGNCVGSG